MKRNQKGSVVFSSAGDRQVAVRSRGEVSLLQFGNKTRISSSLNFLAQVKGEFRALPAALTTQRFLNRLFSVTTSIS